ncbi:unnamed protein product [Heligmosomoides polygyrus]|uniref:DHC_N2 domain-containing protein n=1 Tax=Heligmosomoides polygyrus TaxID=6339 RepID=A0A3P8B622_HELPZ|nr:unnamed protein product [Heligmosomoides polygyrus]
MVSMSKELLAALVSDHTLLSMDDPLPVPVKCWVEKLVEAYLDKQGDQVRCLRRDAAGFELVINGREMHWSVLPLICPYLDMRSLYALTAAYPQWAAMIFRQLKKRMTTVPLHLKSDVKCEYEVYWKVAKPQDRKTENDEEYTKWVELSNLAWKFLSFDLMKITLVRIDQAISDHCAPFLDIHDESREADKEPLVRKTLLANIRTLSYSGYVESLKSDLLAAMDAEHTFLSVHRSPSQPLTRWVASVVEDYLKAQAGNVRSLKRGPEGYEMKRNDASSSARMRRIFVVNCTSDPRAAFDDIEMSFIVENQI